MLERGTEHTSVNFPLVLGHSFWTMHFDILMKNGVAAAVRKLPTIRRKGERMGKSLWSTSHKVIAVMKMTLILPVLTGNERRI